MNPQLPANDLSVQQLRSFCIVFERNSYSAAARELGLAVPTVWEQVQAVERRYATSLFEREGRNIAPTPVARVLFESLRPVLARLDSTFDAVLDNDQSGPTTVTLVTGMRMLIEELAEPLKRFRDQCPESSLRLFHGDNTTAEKMILDGAADLALSLEPGPGMASEDICYEPAYEADYLAVVPPDHPLASRQALSMRRLVEHPLVVGHENTNARRLFDHVLHREGLLGDVQIVVETDNSAFTIACVRAGLGVGVLAGNLNGVLTRDLVRLPLQRHLGRARLVFIWGKNRHMTRATKTLMTLIRELGDVGDK